jgi:UDP-N-acetylmuramate dehydrogenase
MSLQIDQNVELAPYTTYRIGGQAKYFTIARSTTQLTAALGFARDRGIESFLLGTGANILVGDGGFEGLVILNQAATTEFDGTRLRADSGASIQHLISVSAQRGLAGLEHFAGIPSSLGGAMRQNIHFLSPDRQRTLFIAEIVESATLLDEEGQEQKVGSDFFEFGYDFSILHRRPLTVLDVTLKLQPDSPESIKERASANLAWRRQRHPNLRRQPSCGSVFKKIDGVGAGRLIEQSGLKGRRWGGAEISRKHANFIINRSQASAADVRRLIELVQSRVQAETGHWLEPEIGFVGQF